MPTGRTLSRWSQVYINGYDYTGFTQQIGVLAIDARPAEVAVLNDPVRGVLPGIPSVAMGAINGIMIAPTVITVLDGWKGASALVTVAIGGKAAVALGDPSWTGYFPATAALGGTAMQTAVYYNLQFGEYSAEYIPNYVRPWGNVLNPFQARTAVNSSTGMDGGASSALGGFFWYHLYAINAGTVTLLVDDSTDNAAWLALAGATTTALGTVPASGIVQLAVTATVRRYLRWQLVFAGGATTATFACGFNRG